MSKISKIFIKFILICFTYISCSTSKDTRYCRPEKLCNSNKIYSYKCLEERKIRIRHKDGKPVRHHSNSKGVHFENYYQWYERLKKMTKNNFKDPKEIIFFGPDYHVYYERNSNIMSLAQRKFLMIDFDFIHGLSSYDKESKIDEIKETLKYFYKKYGYTFLGYKSTNGYHSYVSSNTFNTQNLENILQFTTQLGTDADALYPFYRYQENLWSTRVNYEKNDDTIEKIYNYYPSLDFIPKPKYYKNAPFYPHYLDPVKLATNNVRILNLNKLIYLFMNGNHRKNGTCVYKNLEKEEEENKENPTSYSNDLLYIYNILYSYLFAHASFNVDLEENEVEKKNRSIREDLYQQGESRAYAAKISKEAKQNAIKNLTHRLFLNIPKFNFSKNDIDTKLIIFRLVTFISSINNTKSYFPDQQNLTRKDLIEIINKETSKNPKTERISDDSILIKLDNYIRVIVNNNLTEIKHIYLEPYLDIDKKDIEKELLDFSKSLFINEKNTLYGNKFRANKIMESIFNYSDVNNTIYDHNLISNTIFSYVFDKKILNHQADLLEHLKLSASNFNFSKNNSKLEEIISQLLLFIVNINSMKHYFPGKKMFSNKNLIEIINKEIELDNPNIKRISYDSILITLDNNTYIVINNGLTAIKHIYSKPVSDLTVSNKEKPFLNLTGKIFNEDSYYGHNFMVNKILEFIYNHYDINNNNTLMYIIFFQIFKNIFPANNKVGFKKSIFKRIKKKKTAKNNKQIFLPLELRYKSKRKEYITSFVNEIISNSSLNFKNYPIKNMKLSLVKRVLKDSLIYISTLPEHIKKNDLDKNYLITKIKEGLVQKKNKKINDFSDDNNLLKMSQKKQMLILNKELTEIYNIFVFKKTPQFLKNILFSEIKPIDIKSVISQIQSSYTIPLSSYKCDYSGFKKETNIFKSKRLSKYLKDTFLKSIINGKYYKFNYPNKKDNFLAFNTDIYYKEKDDNNIDYLIPLLGIIKSSKVKSDKFVNLEYLKLPSHLIRKNLLKEDELVVLDNLKIKCLDLPYFKYKQSC